MRICRQANIVKSSISVIAGDENRTAIEIAGVFDSVSECVHSPGSIVCIRPKIVETRFIRGDRRIGSEFRLWLSEENSSAAGQHPSLVELRDIQMHVRTRVFDAGRNIVNDEAQVMGGCPETDVVE